MTDYKRKITINKSAQSKTNKNKRSRRSNLKIKSTEGKQCIMPILFQQTYSFIYL